MNNEKKKNKLNIRSVLIITLSLMVVVAFVVASASWYTVTTTRNNVHTIQQLVESNDKADAILVLGASVYEDGTPSDILADRLETAVDLYLAGVAPAIIVSGDNRTSHYNESDAMKKFCVELGVPEDAVYVDHAGYDTYGSVWRACNVFGAKDIIITTQAYHLYRAIAIGEGMGMKVFGVPADKGKYDNQMSYSIRELFTRVKDLGATILNVPPEQAGQPIEN